MKKYVIKYLNKNYKFIDTNKKKIFWAARKIPIIYKLNGNRADLFKITEELQQIFTLTKKQVKSHINDWYNLNEKL